MLCEQIHHSPGPLRQDLFGVSVEGPRGTDILLCILSAQELAPFLPLLSSVPLLLTLSLTILGIDSRARGRTGSLDSHPGIHRLLSGVLELVGKIVCDVCLPGFRPKGAMISQKS